MPQLVDRDLVRQRFGRRLASYPRHASIQAGMARRLIDTLVGLRGRTFPRAFEIGCGAGSLTRLIAKGLDIRTFYANDLIDACEAILVKETEGAPFAAVQFIGGDIEGDVLLPSQLDLIVSNATFQWLDDLNTLLPYLASLLDDNGVLAFSTFGPGNLREIRELTRVTLAYLSAATIEGMLCRDFRVLHRWEDLTSLHFDSPLHVMKHLRHTGVNAVNRQSWQRSSLDRFVRAYREQWGAGETVPLTYHPMTFIAEKR